MVYFCGMKREHIGNVLDRRLLTSSRWVFFEKYTSFNRFSTSPESRQSLSMYMMIRFLKITHRYVAFCYSNESVTAAFLSNFHFEYQLFFFFCKEAMHVKRKQSSTRNNNPKMIFFFFLDSTLTLVFGTVNSNKLITKH